MVSISVAAKALFLPAPKAAMMPSVIGTRHDTRAVVDGTRKAMTKPTRIVPMMTLLVFTPTLERIESAIRLSRPVDVMAAARNSAEATSTRAVLAKPLNARPRPALVPISTLGLAGLGESPSRNAMRAAMTIAETA